MAVSHQFSTRGQITEYSLTKEVLHTSEGEINRFRVNIVVGSCKCSEGGGRSQDDGPEKHVG